MEYYSVIKRTELSVMRRDGGNLSTYCYWKRPVWKWYVVQTIGHSGKDTTTDTVKKKKIEGRVEKDELGEQRNFLGQWNYCIWYCNDGYMTLCICANP